MSFLEKDKIINVHNSQIHKEKFSLLLNSIPSVVTYVDSNHYLQYVNSAFEKMFNLEFDAVVGRPMAEFLGKDAYDAIRQYMELALSGRQVHYEMEVPLKDGKRFIEATYTPDIDEYGKVNGYVGLINDIGIQKKTEEALQESKVAYQALMENVPAALCTCDAEGFISLFNKEAAELWGREPEIGKDKWCGSWKIYQPDGDGKTVMELDTCPMALTLKEGRPVRGNEIIIERPDGKRRNVLSHPVPLIDKSGKITGAVNMLLDITDRKVAEKELAHLAGIVHSSTDPIISKTLNGIITSWNEAAERVFGYTSDEMIGQPLARLIPLDRLDEEPMILEQLKNGKVVEHFETKRITKDKKILDVSLTISLVKDKEGNVIGASKIARDITLQKAVSEALRESEERLRMASEATQFGTWEFHPGTKKLIWSEGCKRIYGVPEDFEPSGEFVAEHMHSGDADYVRRETAIAVDPEREGNFQLQYRIFRADNNQMRWLNIRGKVYFNKDKQPERLIGNMLDVTEEKEAEQLIRESEERLRMAVQSTRLGTWEFFPLAGKLSWSEECRKIYNVPEDFEVDYEFFSNHIHPEDVDYAQQEIQKAMEPDSDGSYDIQYRILRYGDRQSKWIRAQGKVYFNLNRQAERFIGTVLDITDEKEQEQELKNSIELFTTMADNVPAMIWMSGEDKFCDYFNKTWLQFTGRTVEEESNEGWVNSVHPDDVQRCIEDYQQSFTEQKGFYTEYRLKRHDGHYRWIADNSVPRYNADGSFAGFISACIDIDDQKNFREKIMESELRLKTISNASPVGLWMTDINAQNIFVNDTWIQWTGIPFEKQLGTGWLDRVIEEDKTIAPARFWEAMQKKEKYSTEFRIIRKDGEMRWCLTEGSPYYDIDGKFGGYAGSVTDITELKKMEERKDDFIKMASHELKTPITSIKGYVELLLSIYAEINQEKLQSSSGIVKSSLTTISNQVTKLTRLVSELLDLSRIESGRLELNKTTFNLSSLVEETVQDARHTTAQHAIIIHNDFDGTVYADKDRISQVLLNLLTNAIKYSAEANLIEVFVSGRKKSVTIKVKDYGIGIDKPDHSKIFQRFYRVEGKSEQTYPGFGIGLFITHEIVQRHGGTVSVESKKGEGSVFAFTLPL